MTLARIRRAAEFCADAGLARFRVEEDGLEIEVRRSLRPARPANAPVATPNAAPSVNGAPAAERRPLAVVKAEFVGIVRLARPAVTAGTVIGGDRELAYVESLGVRNPIRAGDAGRVIAVHVNDGEPVEYGQALFSIEPQ
jgi:biotin carboxyl carrier protein